MPAATCPCSRVVPDAYLCVDCTQRLTTHLRTIANLAVGLDEKRARRAAIRYTHGRARSAERALPYDPRVTHTATPIRAHLHDVAKQVLTHHPNQPAPPDSITAVAGWLAVWTWWLRSRDNAPSILETIEGDAHALTRLFDRPPDRLYLGECGAERSGRPCTEPVYAETRSSVGPAAFTRCVCGATHEVAPRREELLRGLGAYQATMRELIALQPLVGAAGASRTTLHRYVQRGVLRPAGQRLEQNARGEWRRVDAYRIGDMLNALTTAKTRRDPAVNPNPGIP